MGSTLEIIYTYGVIHEHDFNGLVTSIHSFLNCKSVFTNVTLIV